MKRRVLIVLLLLVAGAIVNVAVAWGCACYAPTQDEHQIGEHDWPSTNGSGWPARASFGWRHDGIALTTTTSRAYGLLVAPSQKQRLYGLIRFEAGWPLRAMQWSLFGTADGGTLDYWPDGEDGIWMSGIPPLDVAQDEWQFQRRMPLRPLWPGFAINPVFYALVLWLLFAAPFALRGVRRRRRIKRGLCPKCAYDLRGTPQDAMACPECGHCVS